MAVTEESLHHATDSLILSQPRKYYRAVIHTRHWQLRSLVVSPEQDVVYYPSGSDIFALYTNTKEREIITTLKFAPRCLTVAGGWLCCGGHNGDFSAIPLDDERADSDFSINWDAPPDARLPLNLDRRTQSRNVRTTSRRSRGLNSPLPSKVVKIGSARDSIKEDAINNCITLWFPKGASSGNTYKVPVAVLANNDKSVYIVRLDDCEVLERITYPDCVNRAVISPDGETLVAVLDDPHLYVHQRKEQNNLEDPHVHSSYEWVASCRIQLEGERQADKSDMKGSFALAFSHSGKYLAVATQHGVISVFETARLTDENAEPLAIFTSSRPGDRNGAVRDMEFSPGPTDLLAWTESSDRVGVADIRNLFLTRQLLSTDRRADGVERVGITERPSELIDPRLRSSMTPDYLGMDFERQHLRRLQREMSDRRQGPLTSEELEVLEASSIARRQRDAVAEAPSTSAWGPWAAGTRSTTATTNENNDIRRISTTGLPPALQNFVNPPDRSSSSFRAFINERNQDRNRRNQQPEPRHRTSTILSSAERSIEAETFGNLSSRTGDEAEPSHLLGTPPHSTGTETPSNPWSEIDTLYRSRAAEEASRYNNQRTEAESDDQRGPLHRIEPWRAFREVGFGGRDDSTVLLMRGQLRPRGDNDGGLSVQTMGICWSPNGRIL